MKRDGKPSFGKKNKMTHILCRRCGARAFHVRDKKCSKCGFGETAKLKEYSWQTKKNLGKSRK